MGHRFSKTAANAAATTTSTTKANHIATTLTPSSSAIPNILTETLQPQHQITHTSRIPIPAHNGNHLIGPTINLQIQDSPTGVQNQRQQVTASYNSLTGRATTTDILQQSSNSGSLTSINNLSCSRQIIIKIQLAKMENGNDQPTTTTTTTTTTCLSVPQGTSVSSLETLVTDANCNNLETATAATATSAQILNVTFNRNSSPQSVTALTTAKSTGNSTSHTLTHATIPASSNNNYTLTTCGANGDTLIANESCSAEWLAHLNNINFNDNLLKGNTMGYYGEGSPHTVNSEEVGSEATCNTNNALLASTKTATEALTKRRCRKCSCRDAFRRILDPTSSRTTNKSSKQTRHTQEQKRKENLQQQAQQNHSKCTIINTKSNTNSISNNNNSSPHSSSSSSSSSNTKNSTTSTSCALLTTTTATNTNHSITPSTVVASISQLPMQAEPPATANSNASSGGINKTATNQLSIWSPSSTGTGNGGDVFIPISTPQFVVVQCAIVNATTATATQDTTNTLTRAAIVNANENTASPSMNSTETTAALVSLRNANVTMSTSNGPIVHSQVDFCHYLVPDLVRITNSSFYWGKMDRYEAERLLEGKPEGTFLLRDSAQEEFLFSVTFRKYGRSLHARIEQSGHRFSFDCHDPGVFTAATVTGLLEHYKDPACVMFFEPMLTIPLHRRTCFSLQQLCRATIVSHTTYDGINELELPARLKSYLKEYHYKQKLRVKPFDEPFYAACA
ncbi:putative GPI-anchored protein pfl2 [Glossina fuscipes]|uniref:GPI-anchored protein pfl2 n=1 Tax=Glossina fuscipes TaxID=7396 RepID=A0A9C5YZ00_9MUSC|nr:putative GPI-anchored protein pfl2 [Glossina fuscipes]KAI9584013.1 hypothetical protein GQX74_010348 [Glossina fuscipes]